MVLVAFAAAAYFGLKLRYVGLFAFASGAVTLLYGISGYRLAMTREPFEMLLLFAGFGVSAMMALPATLVVDRFLHHPADRPAFWTWHSATSDQRSRSMGSRAAQPIAPVGVPESSRTVAPRRYSVPAYIAAMSLALPVFLVLAGIVVILFLGTTVPAHLAHAP